MHSQGLCHWISEKEAEKAERGLEIIGKDTKGSEVGGKSRGECEILGHCPSLFFIALFIYQALLVPRGLGRILDFLN